MGSAELDSRCRRSGAENWTAELVLFGWRQKTQGSEREIAAESIHFAVSAARRGRKQSGRRKCRSLRAELFWAIYFSPCHLSPTQCQCAARNLHDPQDYFAFHSAARCSASRWAECASHPGETERRQTRRRPQRPSRSH